ncbi:MAG: TonB-dependent receptor, partial [Ignavibacteriales bacterium]|nr:TonB-dependent receptor [Ignavibacteriales bacterium]
KYKVQRLSDSHFKNIVVSGENELHYKTDEFHVIAAYSFVHAALRSNQLSSLAKRNQHAIALAVESGFLKTVTLFPSIRADIIPEENKKIVTYKAGVNIKPFESTGFSIRGNFGKNFRMPTFNDLYWKEVGSKNINAEYSNNQEAGAWYEFNGIFSGSLDCSFIKIDATDKIIWMPQRNGKWQPMNISKSTSRATSCNANIEKAFDGQLIVRLTAGALFTDARSTNERYPGDPTYNKLFPYVPVHTVKLAMMLQYKEFSCNLFFHHTGDRYADVENLNKMSQQNILDGNVSISQMLFGLKTTARLEVNNIANHDYQMLSDYPLPLRTYTITINLII